MTEGTGETFGAVISQGPSCRITCRWCTERLGGGGDHQQQDADTSGMRVTNHFEPRLSLATFNLRPVPWCGSVTVCAVQRVAKRVPRLHPHPHAVTEMRQVGKYTFGSIRDSISCQARDTKQSKVKVQASPNSAIQPAAYLFTQPPTSHVHLPIPYPRDLPCPIYTAHTDPPRGTCRLIVSGQPPKKVHDDGTHACMLELGSFGESNPIKHSGHVWTT